MLIQRRTNPGKAPAGAAPKTEGEPAVAPQGKSKPVTTTTATIGASLVIRGDVIGTGDLFVSGVIEGTIDLADNQITVDGAGRVEGRIVGKHVRLNGKVTGEVEALHKLSIGSTGTVQGTIAAPCVEVEDGAKLNCRIDIDYDEGRDAPAASGRTKN